LLKDLVNGTLDKLPLLRRGIGGAVGVGAALQLGGHLNGKEPVSKIADLGVRVLGPPIGVTKAGREFDLPFYKACYVTHSSIHNDFPAALAQLCADVINTDGLKLVVQCSYGGGKAIQHDPKLSYMQHRLARVQLVFDVFYEPGAHDAAKEMQERFRNEILHLFAGEDRRMLWASYHNEDDELDMSNPATQVLYYNPDDLQSLRDIKRDIDPKNVFSNTFTVPPSTEN
jgi:hypothetical protein